NILSGLLKPDSGNIQIDGKDVEFHSPRVAQNFGIVTVHQEGEFFSTLSIAENLALATEYPVNRCGLIQFRRMNQQAEKHFCLAQWTDPPQPHDSASVMSIAQRQMLQTAAAIASRPRILVLDEPTSALSQSECDWLFGQIERLKQRGTAILYVSHRLDEVRRIADHVMVMRDGRHVWTRPAADLSRDAMVRGIAGDQPESPTAPSRQQGQPKVAMANSDSPVLVVDGLSDSVHEERAVSLSIQPGEIVGVYGLIGSGRTEFAQTLFGIRKRKRGRVYLNGQEVSIRSPREAVKAGIAYVPEDRLCEGVFSGRSVRANGVIATLGKWSIAGIVRRSQEDLTADQIVSDFDIRCRSTSQTMGTLSGGNQQKVVLGRWLLTAPKVLILDEPTRGVDVRAREEIHSSIKHLTEQGTAVLLISSELSEVTDYCDRVVVFRGGSNVAEFDPRVTSIEPIADAAFPTSESNEHVSRPPHVATHPLAKRLSQLRSRSASGDMVLALCVLALIVLLEASSSGFSLLSLASAASVWTLLSLAAMCVILVGGIDISIGSVLALAAVVAAIILKQPWPTWVSIPVAVSAAIAAGTAAGLLNAWIALAGRVHPIVVTLGTMTI
ncbi:MAG: ATP-binding cassette domain-containing protein, partial [Pirellulaceae bacterium]